MLSTNKVRIWNRQIISVYGTAIFIRPDNGIFHNVFVLSDYQRLGKLLSLNHFGAANTEVQALKVIYYIPIYINWWLMC